MRKIVLLVSVILTSFFVTAQPIPPNCPPSYSAGFDITGDSVSLCNDGVNLTVNGYSTIFNTSSYAVNQIAYNPYPWIGANTIINNVDDCWSAPIQLPFNFCYFGQKYNQVVIGANGQISFDAIGTQPALSAGSNPWNSWNGGSPNNWIAPNNNIGMNNCIMAPFHDIDPSVGYIGQKITWDIYGTYPCRYMVISWDSIPMFSCNDSLSSQQVVLFESTYLIDINIKQKPICSSWNGGIAHEGVQNANGTAAFMVPNRNGTIWSASNDSWRFTPNGAVSANFIYTWIDVPTGAILGTGPTLSYFPATDSKVTVQCSVVTDCDTITAFNSDTIDVIVTGLVTADFNYDIHLGCVDDTVVFTNTSTNGLSTPNQYFWMFGDGGFTTQANPIPHIYLNQQPNPYLVTLIVNNNGCTDTMQKSFTLWHPINATFLAFGSTNSHVDSVCLGENLNLDASFSVPPAGISTFTWDLGNGTIQYLAGSSINNYIYPQSGNYITSLILTDTLGCKDTSSHNIFVEQTPYVALSISDSNVCVGDPIFFYDTMSAGVKTFKYDFGDGTILNNTHDPIYTWSNAGLYNATLSGEYQVCKINDITKQISVEDYPSVNLGADTSICPNLTGAILLTNLNATAGINEWSTGQIANSITVNTPGNYWVKVTSPNGKCVTTDTINVLRDCYLNIPNSFSPNNDGMNDNFLPREILSSGLLSFKMSIYNRWGELIFYTNKLEGKGWDGKYNGINQPMGTYVYVIDAVFDNATIKNFKGNVTLVR